MKMDVCFCVLISSYHSGRSIARRCSCLNNKKKIRKKEEHRGHVDDLFLSHMCMRDAPFRNQLKGLSTEIEFSYKTTNLLLM